jgi:hypothetical protein
MKEIVGHPPLNGVKARKVNVQMMEARRVCGDMTATSAGSALFVDPYRPVK